MNDLKWILQGAFWKKTLEYEITYSSTSSNVEYTAVLFPWSKIYLYTWKQNLIFKRKEGNFLLIFSHLVLTFVFILVTFLLIFFRFTPNPPNTYLLKCGVQKSNVWWKNIIILISIFKQPQLKKRGNKWRILKRMCQAQFNYFRNVILYTLVNNPYV